MARDRVIVTVWRVTQLDDSPDERSRTSVHTVPTEFAIRPESAIQHGRACSRAGLVSVGYEGRSIDDLVRDLHDAQVDLVADVRLTPISRKPGLSKTRLADRLSDEGIGYVHLRALGNPKDNRAAFADERIDQALARYCSIIDADVEARDQLKWLAQTAVDQRVSVLCFEREVLRCHRRAVLDALIADAPTVAYI